MAPRIPDIVEMAREYITGEPAEDQNEQEEYLDRLGVSPIKEEKSYGIHIPNSRDTSYTGSANTRTMPTSGTRAASDVIKGHERDYMSYFDRNFDEVQTYQDRRVIKWSNGETEYRRNSPRRRNAMGDYGEYKIRHRGQTNEVVHKGVNNYKIRMMESMIHDIENMIFDFCHDHKGSPAGELDFQIVSMADHFLEDLSDDIQMRFKVDMVRSPETFCSVIRVFIEMPDVHPIHTTIPLEHWRM